MHNRPDGLAQVEGILRGSTVDLSAFRDATQSWVALDNDDLFAQGELEVTVRTSATSTPTVSLASLDGAAPITGQLRTSSTTSDGARHEVVFPDVPVGAWQLHAETVDARASDSLLVVDPD